MCNNYWRLQQIRGSVWPRLLSRDTYDGCLFHRLGVRLSMAGQPMALILLFRQVQQILLWAEYRLFSLREVYSLGHATWEWTSCRGKGWGTGNGGFSCRRWSPHSRGIAEWKWICSPQRSWPNVPSGSPWYRGDRGFVCTPFLWSLCSWEFWQDWFYLLLVALFWPAWVLFSDLVSHLDNTLLDLLFGENFCPKCVGVNCLPPARDLETTLRSTGDT